MSCFVPSCKNTTGAPFPQDEILKKRWLEGLNLKHLSPQSDSLVCFDHFRLADLEECVEGSTVIKPGACPSVLLKSLQKDVPRMCRICMSEENLVKKISELLEGDVVIMSILMLCCYPVRMSLNDNLPKEICQACLEDLTIAHKLRMRCLSSIKKIQIKLEQQHALKRKLAAEQLQEDYMVIKKPKPTDIKKEEVIEESIENIKRQIEDDSLKEFIKIKDNGRGNKSSSKDELKDLVCALTMDEPAVRTGNVCIGQKIVVAKSALQQFQSATGNFPCSIIECVQKFVFTEADSYLYVHGLLKNNIRNLSCVSKSCTAIAQHAMKKRNCYSHHITVLQPHNHPHYTEMEQKKKMFLYIMGRRVQYDKTLNIKSLYQEYCALDPMLLKLPLKSVISEICRNQISVEKKETSSFEDLFAEIEDVGFNRLHFTMSGRQFYQEKFTSADGALAIVFANKDIVELLSDSQVMYVDASFKIDANEDFKYQMVTVLLWTDDSYYPILYAFVNKKSNDIFKKIFQYLHSTLAPDLRPDEIITEFEANIYYALSETYTTSNIGGSIFYYTQHLYKKVCSLNLSRDLETNTYFRNVFHMLLMLPLLPVNTITDALRNIEVQARDSGVATLAKPFLDYIHKQWMETVTPNMFCVHLSENRINENVISPFKKLRDLILLSKGKNRSQFGISQVVEKLIDLEAFLSDIHEKNDKKSFGRDLSSSQKKNVIRAWCFIEAHPKININHFFGKVLGYIKCMENQLWIWGFYRYIGDSDDDLINAKNFSIIEGDDCMKDNESESSGENATQCAEEVFEQHTEEVAGVEEVIVMEGVLDENGKVVVQTNEESYLP